MQDKSSVKSQADELFKYIYLHDDDDDIKETLKAGKLPHRWSSISSMEMKFEFYFRHFPRDTFCTHRMENNHQRKLHQKINLSKKHLLQQQQLADDA